MNITRTHVGAVFAIFLIGFLGVAAYGEEIGTAFGLIGVDIDLTGAGTVDDPDVEYSRFSFTGVKKDATATGVTGATMRGWIDWNQDSLIDWNAEIFRFTESSGAYTSNIELPLSDPVNSRIYPIWVQGQASTYQITYQDFTITGQRNIDGSAKPIGDMEFILTDDSLTYDGLMGTTAWDDGSDYNYTTYGASKTAHVVAKGGGTASKGLSSQCWEQVDYMTIYGHTKSVEYFLKWDQVESNPSDIEDMMYLGTSFNLYLTLQDYDDSGIKGTSAPFDNKIADQTNVHLLVEDINWSDLFQYSSDAGGFEYFISFLVEIDADWAMAYGLFLQNIDLDDYYDADQSYTTAATNIGTAGIDWDCAG